MKKLLFLFLMGFGVCLWFFRQERPEIIPITLSSSLIPQTRVEIQGYPYLLDVDLGSKHQLVLKTRGFGPPS